MKQFKRLLVLLAALSLLAACRVRISKSMLNLVVSGSNKESTEMTYADSCKNRIAVPYVENGDANQVLDLYYAEPGIRKNVLLIDIHGGFYVAGTRKNNRAFASFFLKRGYDVALVEYRLNDGKRDVSDELADCAAALDYLAVHAEALGLDKNRMFLTGDSAGGHLALYMAEGSEDRSLPVRPQHFTPRGAMLNCPAYDFASFGNLNAFKKDALEWFIGPRYDDKEWMASMSPRTFIGNYNGPLFVSTCTNDFIRDQSLLLKEDCDSLAREVVFVDIASDDKKVAHVHNVIHLDLPESDEVNAAMAAFMEKNL